MATTWTIDQAHSSVEFKIKHLVISTVTGSFKEFSGSMISDDTGFTNATIAFEIQTSSIDTNNEMRDNHLRSVDFFDVDVYPTISFVSTSFAQKSGDEYALLGDLTMRGVTKPVELQVEFGGTNTSPYGVEKIGFEVTGTISRNDFDLNYNSTLETGGLLLGETVKLVASIQLDKQTS